MAQLDASIPLQVKTANLSDLADMYFGTKKFKDDQENSKQERVLRAKQYTLASKADERAGNAEVRAQGEYDQALTDLTTKRQEALHSRLTSYLGEEAEVLDNLPAEKRPEYYYKYLIPSLKKAGLDVSDMPEYGDHLIEGWRKRAMSPGERSSERNAKVKASGSDMYDLKIDKNGNYVYIPKTPVVMQPGQSSNGVISSGVEAAPQMGVVQGDNGPMGYSFPRSGAAPTAVPISNPQAGGAPVERPKIAIPTTVQASIRNNINQGAVVNNILTELANPSVNPTGVGKDLVSKLPYGDQINAFFDEKGEVSRALIGQLSSLKMKDISGAVINAHEMPRLAQWIPQLKDSKERVIMKLRNFNNELLRMNAEMSAQYTSAQGYRPDPLLQKAPVAPQQRPVPQVPYKSSGKTSDGKDFTIEEIP